MFDTATADPSPPDATPRDPWRGEGDAPPPPEGRFTAEEMLRVLVGFATVSADGNLGLMRWIAAYLRHHGLAPILLPDAADPAKVNCHVRIGPDRDGGIVLSGHTDVVPVAGQDWQRPPFRLIREGDRLYGRGSADMKGFCALCLASAPDWAARPLARPIDIVLSYDEEVGCFGAPALARYLMDLKGQPALAVIGEPTLGRPVNAHKGGRGLRTRLIGKAAHSSQPHLGASATRMAARLVTLLYEEADRLATAGARNPGFDPPYTTLNVGMIHGGEAFNIVAPVAEVTWDIRCIPEDDPDRLEAAIRHRIETEILPDFRAAYPEARIETRRAIDVPPLKPDPDGPAESFARALTGANLAGTVAFGTEAGIFQRAGLSSVVLGPGSIDQAHQPDEWIAVAELEKGADLLDRAVAALAA